MKDNLLPKRWWDYIVATVSICTPFSVPNAYLYFKPDSDINRVNLFVIGLIAFVAMCLVYLLFRLLQTVHHQNKQLIEKTTKIEALNINAITLTAEWEEQKETIQKYRNNWDTIGYFIRSICASGKMATYQELKSFYEELDNNWRG